jgi:peptidoglycan/xylan/chitin deacetylase (PgdA/CDA1 family)
MNARTTSAWAAGVAAAAAAAIHFAPSVVVLGQWTPIRALPGGWCRWRGSDRHLVALTFDDGPDPRTTPRVLERLDRLGLRATFFLLGERVGAAPSVVRAIADAGHEIGSHGHVHDHHFVHSPRWVLADLDASLTAIAEHAPRPRWYRPPYGQATAATLVAARMRSVEPVLWSAWGREWVTPDVAGVVRRVAGGLAPGGIVLLHDSDATSPAGTTERVIDALPGIAVELQRRGLESVTLSELVA